MFGLLLAALLTTADLTAADAPPMGEAELKAAMLESLKQPQAAPLTGQRFRFTIPFIEEKHKYVAFKQSARYYYDGSKDTLFTSIGFGELSTQNFETFGTYKLDALPPLQSLFFDVGAMNREIDEHGLPTTFMVTQGDYKYRSFQVNKQSIATSFGVVVPYVQGGRSDLPEGMAPLVVSQIHEPRGKALKVVKGLSLVVEGEVTDLGLHPQVFCGGYRGKGVYKEVTDETQLHISDKQCFVTARITRILVMRGGTMLARWPKHDQAAN